MRTPALTRIRRMRAIAILRHLQNVPLHDLVSMTKADEVCKQYGLDDNKYSRMVGHNRPAVRLVDLAIYIARHDK